MKYFLVLLLILMIGCSKVATIKYSRPDISGRSILLREELLAQATPCVDALSSPPRRYVGAGRLLPSRAVIKEGLVQDFTLNTIDGQKINLSDYKDKKPVLIVFWATWCPFCVEEIPVLNKMAEEYKGKLEILSIDIKESSEKVMDFSKTKGIKYNILLDSAGSVARKYKVSGIPMNLLIDKDWNILYKGHSIEECEKLWQKQYQK